MNKKLAFGLAALCATGAFVACGDGSIVSTDVSDDMAKLSANTDLQELDTNDIKKMMVDAGITPDASTFGSATSSAVDPGSSAAAPGSSSAGVPGVPGVSSSSSMAPLVIASSSSMTVLISSSSAPVVNPGSTENAGAFGTCAPSPSPIKKGGISTWSFKNNSTMFPPADVQAATYEWTFEGSSVPTFSGSGIAGMTVSGAAYAEPGSYGASVKITKADGTSATIACDPIQVNGADIDCTCEAGEAPDVANGESATWTATCTSPGKSGTGYTFAATDYVWSGTGVTGVGATATGAVSAKGDEVTASLKVSNDDGSVVDVTCPAVTAADTREPDYKILKANDNVVFEKAGTFSVTIAGTNPAGCQVQCQTQAMGLSISIDKGDASTGDYSVSLSGITTDICTGSHEFTVNMPMSCVANWW